jgi:hypothetical protein
MIVNDPTERRSVTPRWAIWRDGFTGGELTGIEAYCDRAGVEPAGMLGGSDESRGRRSGVRFHKPDGRDKPGHDGAGKCFDMTESVPWRSLLRRLTIE